MLRNTVKLMSRPFGTSTPVKSYNCEYMAVWEIKKRTQIKSEEQLLKIVREKMKVYQESVMNQPSEREKIVKEICALESKLRESYGFGKDEDLTVFPEFEFKDPKIDDQLD